MKYGVKVIRDFDYSNREGRVVFKSEMREECEAFSKGVAWANDSSITVMVVQMDDSASVCCPYCGCKLTKEERQRMQVFRQRKEERADQEDPA